VTGDPTRTIEAIEVDSDHEVVVSLDCGHTRHVRHRPPLSSHPWVVDPEGRKAHLGTQIECGRCRNLELPAHAREYRRTAEFDETTLPAALRREHRTKAGTWGRIVVLAGRVRYSVFGTTILLDPDRGGVIPPDVPHHLEPEGAVRLYVAFLHLSDDEGAEGDAEAT
jgi:tellurite resistance-related uncharacterized protein